MDNTLSDYTTKPPLNPAERGPLLRDFFSALFKPWERVYLYGRLGKERLKYYSNNTQEIVCLAGRSATRWHDDKKKLVPVPCAFLCSFKAGLGPSVKAIKILEAYEAKGYSIQFCIHPLTCSTRRNATVKTARYILLESDDIPMDEQKAILKLYKARMVSIVFTGKRSFHALLRIKEIGNPTPWGWQQLRSKRISKPKHRWPEYRNLSRQWQAKLDNLGFVVDRRACGIPCQLSRVPSFRHPETQQPSDCVHLNSHAEPWSPIALLPDPEEQQEQDVQFLAGQGSEEGPSVQRESRKTRTAHDLCISTPPRSTFLDWMKIYEKLASNGLPARHERLKLHVALFTAQRVFGWSEREMAHAWRTIIRRAPQHTDKTDEEAVDDMLRAYKATVSHKRPFLPVVSSNMPHPDLKKLKIALEKLGCPCMDKAFRIISRVLIPFAQEMPAQAIAGTLGIHSQHFRKACRGNGYRDAVAWLEGSRIMTTTSHRYMSGIRTKTYRINIALLIWLSGYATDQLDWTLSSSYQLQDLAIA